MSVFPHFTELFRWPILIKPEDFEACFYLNVACFPLSFAFYLLAAIHLEYLPSRITLGLRVLGDDLPCYSNLWDRCRLLLDLCN